MNVAPLVRAALVCGILLSSSVLFAQQKGNAAKKPAAEVNVVKFKAVAVGGVKEQMTRAEVDIRALANGKLLEDPTAVVPNPDWVDRIKVTLTLGYKARLSKNARQPGAAKPETPFLYYRASSTVLTMRANDSGIVYFYMPGEIIKRDELAKEPELWMVDIEVDGSAVPLAKKMFTTKIKNEADLKTFREQADRGVSDNAGILRTQWQVFDFNTPNSLTLVREDSTRL